ncbi:phosphoribosylaminoimidazole-succinocarboxamide synthase [Colletotrichum falcatum]|nr:phosphoribosylaminoimidazole-succinocarboxamide synthase [Colletotrichum falcatum]
MYSRDARPDAFAQEQRGQYPPQFWSARTPSQQSSTPNTLRPHHATSRHYANGVEEQDSSPQQTVSPPPDFIPPAPSPPSRQQQTQPQANPYRPDQTFPAPVVIGTMYDAEDPYVSAPAVRFNEAQLAVDEITNRVRSKGFRDELTIAANGSVTPGVDDTPYLRYALEALTREHGLNFSPPSSVPSPAARNDGYYRVAGYLPDDLESQRINGDPETGFAPAAPVPSHARDSLRRQSRPQSNAAERPSMSLGTRIFSNTPPQSAHHRHEQAPATGESSPKWLPISEKETVFPGMNKLDTMDEDRTMFPRLNYLPAILRLPSMAVLAVMCAAMAACLVVAAVYSPIQPGLLTWGETIYSGKYFLFRLLPQIVAVVIFVYTQCVAATTLRILPFAAMSEDEPLRRRNALFQNMYPTTFLLPHLAGPVHVKIALVMLWLGAFAIPLASASFTVILNDGVWYWSAVQGVVWALVGLYFLVMAAVVLLALFWRNRVTGLVWDPRSIADLSVMISRSNTRDSYRGSEVAEDRTALRRILRNRIVDRLGYWMTDNNNQEAPWYGLGTEHSQGHNPSDHYDVKNESDRLSVTSHLIEEGRDGYIQTLYLPWCLRTGQVLFFVVAATVLLAALFVVSFLHRTSLIAGFQPGVPVGPNPAAFSAANFLYSFVPSLIGLLLYLAFQSIEQHVRILQPWADLNAKDGAPAGHSILADYAACLPLQSTLHAIHNGHWRVAALSLLTVLIAFLPALSGGLFMALTATSGVRMFPNVPVFGVILGLLVLYLAGLASLLVGRNQYRLPHAVTCPAEVFSFLANEDNAQDPAFQAAPRSAEKLRVYLGAGPRSTQTATQSTWMFGYWPGRDERRLGVRRQKRFTERQPFERAPSRPFMI